MSRILYFISFTVFITAFVALNANNKEGDEAKSQYEMEIENDDLIKKNNGNDNNYDEENVYYDDYDGDNMNEDKMEKDYNWREGDNIIDDHQCNLILNLFVCLFFFNNKTRNRNAELRTTQSILFCS